MHLSLNLINLSALLLLLLLLAALLEESTLGVEGLLAPSGHVSDGCLKKRSRQVSRSARQSDFELCSCLRFAGRKPLLLFPHPSLTEPL